MCCAMLPMVTEHLTVPTGRQSTRGQFIANDNCTVHTARTECTYSHNYDNYNYNYYGSYIVRHTSVILRHVGGLHDLSTTTWIDCLQVHSFTRCQIILFVTSVFLLLASFFMHIVTLFLIVMQYYMPCDANLGEVASITFVQTIWILSKLKYMLGSMAEVGPSGHNFSDGSSSPTSSIVEGLLVHPRMYCISSCCRAEMYPVVDYHISTAKYGLFSTVFLVKTVCRCT